MKTATKKLLLMPSLALIFSFFAETVMAHCPLCTMGAAAAAGGASLLGVNNGVIGVFIGAFAVSVGFMVAKALNKRFKKQYIPYQDAAIILFSFATTVIPLMPIIPSIYPVSIFIAGDYGSLLNRTYIINLFLAGSILGGMIMSITPWLSAKITDMRNGRMMMPYQGIILTLLLLVAAGFVIQFTT